MLWPTALPKSLPGAPRHPAPREAVSSVTKVSPRLRARRGFALPRLRRLAFAAEGVTSALVYKERVVRDLGCNGDADSRRRSNPIHSCGAFSMKTQTSQTLDAVYIMALCELANSELERVMKYITYHGERLPNSDEVVSSLNETCSRLEVARQVAELALLEPRAQLELAL